jgi:hypothetical protein
MNVVGNVLSVNDKGQLVDQNGNVISQGNYEQLPEGYKYVVNDDGIISVVLVTDTTTLANALGSPDSGLSDDVTRKIVIIASSVLCALLIIALVVVAVVSKKTKNDASKVRARRQKELKKKAKAQAKANKKSKKK